MRFFDIGDRVSYRYWSRITQSFWFMNGVVTHLVADNSYVVKTDRNGHHLCLHESKLGGERLVDEHCPHQVCQPLQRR